eukprot:1141537-Pelagomonas_calceolata.AAC.1
MCNGCSIHVALLQGMCSAIPAPAANSAAARISLPQSIHPCIIALAFMCHPLHVPSCVMPCMILHAPSLARAFMCHPLHEPSCVMPCTCLHVPSLAHAIPMQVVNNEGRVLYMNEDMRKFLGVKDIAVSMLA